jgi:transcriptional regulator with XRE-family HTH domain/tetratricopeptide (TPR) repeat protein
MATGGSSLPFAALLRRYRKAARISQEELAERAGFSAVYISMLERGLRSPVSTSVALLAHALALSPEECSTLEAAARSASSPTPAVRSSAARAAVPRVPVGGFLGALPDSPLVARDAEMERLLAALDRAVQGDGRLVLLAGEPGIGKTRLAQELTVAARERGVLVATGRCYEPQQSVAYYPFLEALALAYSAAPADLRTTVPHRWPEVARLLPDQVPDQEGIATSPSGTTPSGAAPAGGGHDQQRLFWQTTAFLQALATRRPVALLLDDLHWADASSLDLLQHLARQTRTARLLLLGTYRDVAVGRQHPLQTALRDLRRDRLIERIDVRRLSLEGTRALVVAQLEAKSTTATVTALSDDSIRLLFERTEGNPFFTQEVVQTLMARGDATALQGGDSFQHSLVDLDLPESIRAVIGERLSRLSPVAQEVLREASVLGQTWAFEELQALGGRGEADLEAALEEAVNAGLIQEAGRDSYTFSHALIQQALYRELSSRKKRRLHRAAGEVLEQLPTRRRERRAAEVAWHYLEADEAARALPYALQAGDQAEAVYADTEAEQHYQTAVERAHEIGDEASEARALEQLGTTLVRLGRQDAGFEYLDRSLRGYQAVQDRAGELRVIAELIGIYANRGALDEGVARAQAVLGAAEAELQTTDALAPAVGAVYVSFAGASYLRGRFQEALEWAGRAEALARAARDDALLLEALLWRNLAAVELGADGQRVGWDRLITLAERLGHLGILAWSLTGAGYEYLEDGAFARAGLYLQRAVEVAEQRRIPARIASTLLNCGECSFLAGEWARARQEFATAVVLRQESEPHGTNWDSAGLPLGLGKQDLAEGHEGEGTRLLQEALDLAGRIDEWQSLIVATTTLAERDLLAGRAVAAHERLAALPAQPGIRDSFRSMSILVPALAWAHLEMGRDEEAAAIMTTLPSRAPRISVVEARRVRALIAIRQERWGDAASDLDEAIDVARAMPYPYAEAKALYVCGQLHAAKGEPELAREKYEAALLVCARLGEGLYRPHIERALTALTGHEGPMTSA